MMNPGPNFSGMSPRSKTFTVPFRSEDTPKQNGNASLMQRLNTNSEIL